MKKIYIIIFLLLSFAGCKKETTEYNPVIKIGLNEKDAALFFWDGYMQYETTINGRAAWHIGCSAKGTFSNPSNNFKTTIDLKLIFNEKDELLVTGNVESNKPYKLFYLGSAEEESQFLTESIKAGKNKIDRKIHEIIYTYSEK